MFEKRSKNVDENGPHVWQIAEDTLFGVSSALRYSKQPVNPSLFIYVVVLLKLIL